MHRTEAAATMFFTVPGPKMIWEWEELGYDHSKFTCSDGSTVILDNDSCKLSLKPIAWNYYSDPYRYHLYQVFSSLIKLKEKNDLFRTTDFSLSVTAPTKTMHLNSASANATILANFDLVSKDMDPAFQHTGTWYEYFSHTNIDVTDVNAKITLGPGDYRLYTDVQLAAPDIIPLAVRNVNNDNNIIRLYPNPTTGNFTLVPSETGQLTLALYDVSGSKVFEYRGFAQGKSAIYLDPALPSGFYMYEVKINSSLSQGKLIIR